MADLYLPLRPGTDLALLMGCCTSSCVMDWRIAEFISHTRPALSLAESSQWDLGQGAENDGRPPESIERGGALVGKSKRGGAIMMHARGLEHQSKVWRIAWLLNIALARETLVARRGATMITGQGNGQWTRAWPEMRPTSRSALVSPIPRSRVYCGVWGIKPEELPQPGSARKRS